MPTTITNGQTPLTLQDFVDQLKSEDHDYFSGTPNFITPMQSAITKYAKTYAGNYYKKPSQSSAPTAFGAAVETGTFGSFYEEPVPTDCIDGGLASIEIFYTSNQSVPNVQIAINDSEQTWTTDGSNTANIFARQCGRKMRLYLPLPLASCAGLKHSESYVRYPTLPSALGDQLDAPADDTDSLYEIWKPKIQKV